MPASRWRASRESLWSRLGLCVAGTAVAVLLFDRAFARFRALSPASPDNLIYYNALLEWWHRGTPPNGYTLLPSPYFIDLALEAWPALGEGDFEAFSYDLALIYAVALFAATVVLARAFRHSLAASLSIGVVTLALYYHFVPFELHAHAFMQNHTSEIFCGLLTVAFLVRRTPHAGWRDAVIYLAWTALNVASSPFYIATFVAPAIVGVALVSGTTTLSHRRGASFVGLNAVAVLGGLSVDAALAHGFWPIRGHDYTNDLAAGVRMAHDVWSSALPWTLRGLVLAAFVASAAAACSLRFGLGRPRRAVAPSAAAVRWIFVLAFGATTLVTCVGLPVARGAFVSPYELRYLQEPVFLTCLALAAAGASAISRAIAWTGWASRWSAPTVRRLGGAAAWGVAILALALAKGPFDMRDARSATAPMLACFAELEARAGLQSGVSTPLGARFLNAARHAKTWRALGEPIIEVIPSLPPTVSAVENNLFWVRRHARDAVFNFIVNDGFTDETLAFFRRRVGEPSVIQTCPWPRAFNLTGAVELWVYEDEEAQKRLRDLVVHDPMTRSFTPWSTETRLVFDTRWAVHSPDGFGGVDERGAFVWRRVDGVEPSVAFSSNSTFLPSGSYTLRIAGAVDAPIGEEPLVVAYQGSRELGRGTLAREGETTFAFDVYNRGGATSGGIFYVQILPIGARSFRVDSLEIERMQIAGVDWLRLFR